MKWKTTLTISCLIAGLSLVSAKAQYVSQESAGSSSADMTSVEQMLQKNLQEMENQLSALEQGVVTGLSSEEQESRKADLHAQIQNAEKILRQTRVSQSLLASSEPENSRKQKELQAELDELRNKLALTLNSWSEDSSPAQFVMQQIAQLEAQLDRSQEESGFVVIARSTDSYEQRLERLDLLEKQLNENQLPWSPDSDMGQFLQETINEKRSETRFRVPLFDDIPVIGPLVKRTDRKIESLSARNKPEPLILSEGRIEADAYGEMIEDMSIMSRILDKTLVEVVGKDRSEMVMGIVVSSLADKSAFQSVYLDGYGAMFTLNVDFPLVPTAEEPQAEVEEPVKNEAWEAAKQELFASPDGAQLRGLGSEANAVKNYDAEKVEQLKSSLLESLKNVTNMRHLKVDDKITVAVLSDRPKSESDLENMPVASRSVLMIQTTKADVDAVANGDLSDEEFVEKVSVSLY